MHSEHPPPSLDESLPDYSAIRVLVVDPLQMWHGLVGSFLKHELHLHSPVLTAETAESGIRQFRAHHPDLVITELNLPGGPPGTAMIARIREDDPRANILIHTAATNLQILRAGARTQPRGFVHKTDSIKTLFQSIEMALCGGSSTSPTIEKLLHCSMTAGHRDFTDQELLVVSLIANDEPSKAIAHHVGRSEKAIESLRGRIMERAGVRTQIGLVRYAIREGFVEA